MVLASLHDKCLAQVVLICVVLNTDDRKRVMDDFYAGKAFIEYILILKLGFWETLPYKLAVLGHPDEEVARVGGQRIVEKFNKDPREDAHDQITGI